MTNHPWVNAADGDNNLVVDVLRKLYADSPPLPPPPPPSPEQDPPVTVPLNWSVRQRRSRSRIAPRPIAGAISSNPTASSSATAPTSSVNGDLIVGGVDESVGGTVNTSDDVVSRAKGVVPMPELILVNCDCKKSGQMGYPTISPTASTTTLETLVVCCISLLVKRIAKLKTENKGKAISEEENGKATPTKRRRKRKQPETLKDIIEEHKRKKKTRPEKKLQNKPVPLDEPQEPKVAETEQPEEAEPHGSEVAEPEGVKVAETERPEVAEPHGLEVAEPQGEVAETRGPEVAEPEGVKVAVLAEPQGAEVAATGEIQGLEMMEDGGTPETIAVGEPQDKTDDHDDEEEGRYILPDLNNHDDEEEGRYILPDLNIPIVDDTFL